MNRLIFLLILLLIPPCSYAATISGNVYDIELNKLSNTLITLNTTPLQKIISENGSYSFEVEPGTYLLTARNQEDLTKESVIVNSTGNFRIDLILLPELNQDEDLYNQSNDDLSILEEDSSSYWWIYLIVILLIISSILIFIKKKKPELSEDDLENKLLNLIQKEKRITQKELRKNFPYSEAKVSLLLTELEHKNKIEKIKKGRTNIIKLK